MALSAGEIIKRGYFDVHVKVAGIRQCHRLVVAKEKTAFGEINCLAAKADLPDAELIRVANELQLPVKSPRTIVFPKGKGPGDFVVL